MRLIIAAGASKVPCAESVKLQLFDNLVKLPYLPRCQAFYFFMLIGNEKTYCLKVIEVNTCLLEYVKWIFASSNHFIAQFNIT